MNPATQKNGISNGNVARNQEGNTAMLDLVRYHEYIYVDTCSLQRRSFFSMYEKLKPLLKAYGKKLIVPQSVMVELYSNDTELFEEFVKLVREEGSMILIETDTRELLSTFADHYIFFRFAEIGIHSRVALITQDGGLIKDLLVLNTLTSIRGYKVEVYTLGRMGLELAPRENEKTDEIAASAPGKMAESASEPKPESCSSLSLIRQIKEMIEKSELDKKFRRWTKKLGYLFS